MVNDEKKTPDGKNASLQDSKPLKDSGNQRNFHYPQKNNDRRKRGPEPPRGKDNLPSSPENGAISTKRETGTDIEGTEGMSARGRLKLVKSLMSGELELSPLLSERLFSCILCGACSSVCPLGINIPELIHKGRHLLKIRDKRRRFMRYLLKFSTTWPDLSFKILSMGQDFLIPFLSKRRIIPFNPDIPDQPFHALEQVHKVPKKKGRVAIFTGCSVNYLFPHLGESLINVLQSLGYEVVLPKDEVCCGAPLRALGMEEEAAELARNNQRVFSRLKVDAILSLCPTCTLTLKHDYMTLEGFLAAETATAR